MKKLLLIAVALLTATPFLQGPPTTQTLPLDEYWETLAEFHQTLIALADQPPADIELPLADLISQLTAITAVALPSGETIPVSHAHLTGILQKAEPDIQTAASLLGTILARGDTRPRESYGAPEVAALKNILAAPEFQWPPPAPNPLQQLYARILGWIGRILDRLFPNGVPDGGAVRAALTVITAIILAFALYSIFNTTLTSLVSETEIDSAHPDAEILSAERAFQRAQDLARTGDHRIAIRYLYLSALLILEERNLLRYNRTLTNREYLKIMSRHPHLLARLQPVVDVFDRVWYGYQQVDQPMFDEYARAVAELKEQK